MRAARGTSIVRTLSLTAIGLLLVGCTNEASQQAAPRAEVRLDPEQPCELLTPEEVETAIGTEVDGEREVDSHQPGTRICSYRTTKPWASVSVSLETDVSPEGFEKEMRRDPRNTERVEDIGDGAFIHACAGIIVNTSDVMVTASIQHLTTCEETSVVLTNLGRVLAEAVSASGVVRSQPDPTVSETKPPITQEIKVTRDTDLGPEACRPRQVGETVVNHFQAINQGDPEEAMSHVDPEGGWYSVTEGNPRRDGRHFVTSDSDELLGYLTDRVAVNERVYLREIDVGYDDARNLGHVSYVLVRTADDLDVYGDIAQGKGAIECDTGKIRVWSMAQAKGIMRGMLGVCPGEPDPPEIALVCARG